MFHLLMKYKDREGSVNDMPRTHQEEGEKLGAWLYRQRTAHNNQSLPPYRYQRLREEAGLVFLESLQESWDRMFEALQDYKNRHGHCNVPQLGIRGSPESTLGTW